MVWINYQHFNQTVPAGMLGGSMCLCRECVKKRNKEKDAIKIMQDAQVDSAITTEDEQEELRQPPIVRG